MISIKLLSLLVCFYMKLSDGLPCGCGNSPPPTERPYSPPNCNHEFTPNEPRPCNHNNDDHDHLDDNKCMEENYRPINDNHYENVPKPGSQCSQEVNNQGEHIQNVEGCSCGLRAIKEEPIKNKSCEHANDNIVEEHNNPVIKPRYEQNSHSQFEGEVTGVKDLQDEGQPEGNENACGCGRINEIGETSKCDKHEVIIPHQDNDKNIECGHGEIGQDLNEHTPKAIDDKDDRIRNVKHADNRSHEDRDKKAFDAINHKISTEHDNNDINRCGCGRINEHDHDDGGKIREPVVINKHDDIGHLEHGDHDDLNRHDDQHDRNLNGCGCGNVHEITEPIKYERHDQDHDHDVRKNNRPVVITKHIDNGQTLSNHGKNNDEIHNDNEHIKSDLKEHEIGGNEYGCGKLNENNERNKCNEHDHDDEQTGKPVVITKHEHHAHRRTKPAVHDNNFNECGCGKVDEKGAPIKCDRHDNHDGPVVITKHEVNECPNGGHDNHNNDLNACGCGRNNEKNEVINSQKHDNDDNHRIHKKHEPRVITKKEDDDHKGNEHEGHDRDLNDCTCGRVDEKGENFKCERHENDDNHGIRGDRDLVINKRIGDEHREDDHGDRNRDSNKCGCGKTTGGIISEKHDNDDNHRIQREHEPTVIIKKEDNDHKGNEIGPNDCTCGRVDEKGENSKCERHDNDDNRGIRGDRDLVINKRIGDEHREDDHGDRSRDLNECGGGKTTGGIISEKHDNDDDHRIQREHEPTVIIKREDDDHKGNEHENHEIGSNDCTCGRVDERGENSKCERHDNDDNHGIQDERDLVINKRIDDGHREDEHGNHDRDLKESGCGKTTGGIGIEKHDNDDDHRIHREHEPRVIIRKEDNDHKDNEIGPNDCTCGRVDEKGENSKCERHDNDDNRGIRDDRDLVINKRIDDENREDDHGDRNRDLNECGGGKTTGGIISEKHDNDNDHRIQREHEPIVILKKENDDHKGNEHEEHDRDLNDCTCGRVDEKGGKSNCERHGNDDNHGIRGDRDLFINKRIDDGHQEDEHGDYTRDLKDSGFGKTTGRIGIETHDNDDDHRMHREHEPTVAINKDDNDHRDLDHKRNLNNCNCGNIDERGENAKCERHDNDNNHGIHDDHNLDINKRLDDAHREDDHGDRKRDLNDDGCGRTHDNNEGRRDKDDSHRIRKVPIVITKDDDNNHRDDGHERNLNNCNCGRVEDDKCERHDNDGNHGIHGEDERLLNKQIDDAHREDEHGDYNKGLDNCQCGRINERGEAVNCQQHNNNKDLALLERKDNDDILNQRDCGNVNDVLRHDNDVDHRIGRDIDETHDKNGDDALKREERIHNDKQEPVIVNKHEVDRPTETCGKCNGNEHNNCENHDNENQKINHEGHEPLIINKDDNNRQTECDHEVNNNDLKPCACGLTNNETQCGCGKPEKIDTPIKSDLNNNNDDHRAQSEHELRSGGCGCGRNNEYNRQDNLCPSCGRKSNQGTGGCNCGKQ